MNLPASAKHSTLISVTTIGVIAAILAAVADALYAPLVKLVSSDAGIIMSIAFVLFGAGCGSLIILFFGRKSKVLFDPKRHLQKKDLGKIICIIILVVLGMCLKFAGLQLESAAISSILQNVIAISTVILAALFLKEKISKRLGIGVALIVLGSVALAITDIATFSFSLGSLLIIAGCIALGASFIFTKLLAERNPVEIIIIRGFAGGIIAFIIALCIGDALPSLQDALGLMTVGFIGCGLAPMLLIYGQRYLGAAKSGAIYGIYPLLGVFFSIPILGEMPTPALLAALILFIPGMYFVIVKHNGREAEQGPDEDDSGEKDVRGLLSVSEKRKTVMKNQLTSLGLLVTAMFFVMLLLGMLSPAADAASDAADLLFSSGYIIGLVFGVFLLIIGTLLLILGKRVLTAVTFILMASPIFSFVLLGDNPIVHVLSGIFSIIFALILLTSKDPQKYAYAAVNLLLGAALISYLFNSMVCSIIVAAAAAYLIWLAFSSGTGRFRYSLSKHLREDGEMTFGRCGAVIGYLLFAEIVAFSIAYQFTGTAFDSSLSGLGIINSFFQIGMLVFVGVLLMVIGKRRTTSVFFIGLGITILLDTLSSGVFEYLPVIFVLLFGIMTLLRKDSPILPAIILIGDAFATLLYIQSAAIPEIQTATLLLTLVCGIVALYLSFAVFSEKPKLPVF